MAHFAIRKSLTCRFGEIGAAYSGCIFPVPDKPDRLCYYDGLCPILPERDESVMETVTMIAARSLQETNALVICNRIQEA